MLVNITSDEIFLLIFLLVIGFIIWEFMTAGTENKKIKQPKGFKKYKYRKNERIDLNKQATSRWKAKTKNKLDPEMFSNEPLTYEKAGQLKTKAYNRKYHDYIQAQLSLIHI